jgi:transcriptional regulator with XRE-family HTH domain
MTGDIGSLGAELRRLRGQMPLRDLADRTGISFGTLGRYETGRRRPSVEKLAEVLDALNVENSEREHLLEMVRREGPGEVVAGVPTMGRQLAHLTGYERAAIRITQVALAVVPGILQAREYAHALLAEEPDVKRRVRLRMERAEILTRDEEPVELHVIVHEEALTRPVVPPEVIRQQMQHLLRMAERPNTDASGASSGRTAVRCRASTGATAPSTRAAIHSPTAPTSSASCANRRSGTAFHRRY